MTLTLEWGKEHASLATAALMCCMFGLMFLSFGMPPICKASLKRSRCGKITIGRITSFEVWEDCYWDENHDETYTVYTPVVEYSAAGKMYRASRAIFGAEDRSKRVDKNGKVTFDPGLKEGAAIKLFYNRHAPSEAAYAVKMRSETIVAATGAALIAAAIAIISLGGWAIK
ncbi:MAG: DUF3592 domain-containing protein [Synergistaceae bacterium]|nr:DUF3592 domain-containing protein [Synergistaceae bacterium]